MKKGKERREEPLGTKSYQTSSKRSPSFWLQKTCRPFRLSLAPFICPSVSEDEFLMTRSWLWETRELSKAGRIRGRGGGGGVMNSVSRGNSRRDKVPVGQISQQKL